MTYTKEQVITIELKKAKDTARDYEKAEHAYRMARGLVSENEETILLNNVFIHARVLASHIRNLENIEATVEFYNKPNILPRNFKVQ